MLLTGLPEQLSLLVLKIGVSVDTPEDTILFAIDCLNHVLNYVMSVVKSALQVTYPIVQIYYIIHFYQIFLEYTNLVRH